MGRAERGYVSRERARVIQDLFIIAWGLYCWRE